MEMNTLASSSMIVERAYAKLNFTLEVIRRRSDGYHDLASVIQTVSLYDTLTFSLSDELSMRCDDDSLGLGDNLVLRAARLLQDVAGTDYGATIELSKRIPISSGLGGGSADAAATLRGLNRLWELGMNMEDLIDVGASIGSDVPFLVRGGTAIVHGKGGQFEALPTPESVRLVILALEADIVELRSDDGLSKTAQMFRLLGDSMHTSGSLSRKLAVRMRGGGDCHPSFMFNVFQQIAQSVYVGWQDAYDCFSSLGARDITLSGAGPSMFAVASGREIGTAWALLLSRRLDQCKAYSVETVGGLT